MRHALVDTNGRALVLFPHPASIQDRDGAGRSCRPQGFRFPSLRRPSPIQAIKAHAWLKPLPSPWRSSSKSLIRSASQSSEGASSPGSAATAGYRRTPRLHRIRNGIPLRRSRHNPRQTHRVQLMSSFGTESLRTILHSSYSSPTCEPPACRRFRNSVFSTLP